MHSQLKQELDHIILEALHKKAENRPSSAQDFAYNLVKFLDQAPENFSY